jgi:predicted lipoprotein with Yx(FWY)xxD motif
VMRHHSRPAAPITAQLRLMIVKHAPTCLTASVALTLMTLACSTGYTSSTSRATPPAGSPGALATAGTSNGGSTIGAASARLGQIVVDRSGRTVYLFEADKTRDSTCYKACARAWPPVIATGAPRADNGVSSALLGTTKRTDGTTQVTYGGHPLYYFIGDTKPGDVNGQGLNQFGAKWYVLSPKGQKIDTD